MRSPSTILGVTLQPIYLEVGASWADRPSAVAEVSEEAKKRGGLSAFLEARDNPFRPEPFGPRSK